MIDLTELVLALIGICSALVTCFAIPYLKTVITTARLEQFHKIVFVAISAAEQLGVTNIIKDKFNYAEDLIEKELKKVSLKFDKNQIKAAIEAAVRQNFPKK